MADAPLEEKLDTLDRLRARSDDKIKSKTPDNTTPTPNDPKTNSHTRFGGRSTADGVGYEIDIAALLAVKAMAGGVASVFDGVTGDQIKAITLQAPEPVDDVVVDLTNPERGRIFISAKKRGNSIKLGSTDSTFDETVTSFIEQFLKLPEEQRESSRLVWAVPSTAGRPVSSALPAALAAHRKDAGDDKLAEFLGRRKKSEREALQRFVQHAETKWKEQTTLPADEVNLRKFLRMTYVEVFDLEEYHRFLREVHGEIASHIASDKNDAPVIWNCLLQWMDQADRRGIRMTPDSVRQQLRDTGCALRSTPDYSSDIQRLQELTQLNISRLKGHSQLPFGKSEKERIHIERASELSALCSAVDKSHLLLTGEPGCGKSGLLFSLAKKLERDSKAVVVLLAEEISSWDWTGAGSVRGINTPPQRDSHRLARRWLSDHRCTRCSTRSRHPSASQDSDA